MIILSTDKDKINTAFKRYVNELSYLKLIPQNSSLPEVPYTKKFWENKNSKEPYYWGNIKDNGIPWLSFLGYQIRNTGVIRVRKTSIIKEIEKQVNISTELIRSFKKRGKFQPHRFSKVNQNRVIFRFRKKLIAMSVGKFKNGDSNNSFCWVTGFDLLKKYPASLHNIRLLDKKRRRQIGRIKRKFSPLLLSDAKKSSLADDIKGDLSQVDTFKHSYYRQFIS